MPNPRLPADCLLPDCGGGGPGSVASFLSEAVVEPFETDEYLPSISLEKIEQVPSTKKPKVFNVQKTF